MSDKDDRIHQLEIALARAEGERDEARKQHSAPVSWYPYYPYFQVGYTCANCGMWVVGPHVCHYVQPIWTYPCHINTPIVWSCSTTTTAAPSNFTITNMQLSETVE